MSSGYSLRKINISDEKEIEAVLEFHVAYFVKNEPMLVAAKLDVNKLDLRHATHIRNSILKDVSLLAVDDQGCIVGMGINGVCRRGEEKPNRPEPAEPDPILKLLDLIDQQINMWEVLPETCDTVFTIDMCAVKDGWTRRGILTALLKESERLARSVNAGALYMMASSAFTARAADKLGYTVISRFAYKDQTFITPPDPPHLEARHYIKQL